MKWGASTPRIHKCQDANWAHKNLLHCNPFGPARITNADAQPKRQNPVQLLHCQHCNFGTLNPFTFCKFSILGNEPKTVLFPNGTAAFGTRNLPMHWKQRANLDVTGQLTDQHSCRLLHWCLCDHILAKMGIVNVIRININFYILFG